MTAVWTEEALEEVRGIYRILARRSEPLALRVLDQLLRASETLAEFPLLGLITPEYGLTQIRKLVVDRYRLMYHVLPDRIEILGVFHGASRPKFE